MSSYYTQDTAMNVIDVKNAQGETLCQVISKEDNITPEDRAIARLLMRALNHLEECEH